MLPGQMSKLTQGKLTTTAATIAPLHDYVRLTGTTSIATITPPPHFQASGGGILFLIPTGGDVALLTTGNIALAVTMTSKKVTVLVYDTSTSLWYPNV